MRTTRVVLAGAVSSLALTAVVIPTLGHASGACNTDWPMFAHDQSRSGDSVCSPIGTTTATPASAETLAPSWFFQTPGAVTAEPAIVAGTAYVGDYEGKFYGIDMATGKLASTWKQPFDIKNNAKHNDAHNPSYGEITSSAAVANIPSLGRTVFFGGGGTVYAVDAATGQPRWATDVDPANPHSSAEVESSPVVWTPANGNSIVFVGMDTNEDTGGVDGGILALNATTGELLWKFDADRNAVLDSLTADGPSTGCGDIWSSPALDRSRGLLYFSGGNCNVPQNADHPSGDTEFLYAINADGGKLRWRFEEPPANHTHDTDFGATPILTHVRGHDVVVEAGKSGHVYAVDRASGALVGSYHPADGGDIGGFIGSGSVSVVNGHATFFGDSAIPVHTDFNPTDSSTSPVDPKATDNPLGATSLHSLDLETGNYVWDEPAQTPSYAPTTVVNDVILAPDTTQFSVDAFDATTGAPVWRLPIGAATSGGVAVSGTSLVVGVGTFFGQESPDDVIAQTPLPVPATGAPPEGIPPQLTGVWCFRSPLAS